MDEGMAISVYAPNYTPVDWRKGYVDLEAFRVVIEEGVMVGVYPPNGLEHDPVVMGDAEALKGVHR